jgi:nitroreductase
MSILELVRKARSVRRYDASRSVSRDDLLGLVDAARQAPCGNNRQRLRYRLVHEPDECQCMFPFIKWAGSLKEWDGPTEGERPTGYIVILSEDDPRTDVGIAGAVMQLAAAERGLGTCMLGSIKRDEIKSALSIPEQLNVLLLIAVGYPSETVVLEDASVGESLNYYRTEDGRHHVPKLRLADIIIGP